MFIGLKVNDSNRIKSRSIALVGLPGSGKTTVGRSLSRMTGLDFIDTDQVIESKIGCSIREFFDQNGEAEFRRIEASTIEELSVIENCVLSTGGGAVLNSENRKYLKTCFEAVYLRANPQDLFRRLRHDKKRPLLQVSQPMQALTNIFDVRDPLYREVAQVVVETGKPPVLALVETIMQNLNLHKTSAVSPKNS